MDKKQVSKALEELDQWCPSWLSDYPAAEELYAALVNEMERINRLYAE